MNILRVISLRVSSFHFRPSLRFFWLRLSGIHTCPYCCVFPLQLPYLSGWFWVSLSSIWLTNLLYQLLLFLLSFSDSFSWWLISCTVGWSHSCSFDLVRFWRSFSGLMPSNFHPFWWFWPLKVCFHRRNTWIILLFIFVFGCSYEASFLWLWTPFVWFYDVGGYQANSWRSMKFYFDFMAFSRRNHAFLEWRSWFSYGWKGREARIQR